MFNLLTKIFGSKYERELKQFKPLLEEVRKSQKKVNPLSDSDLKAKSDYFKSQIDKGQSLDELLPSAFAVCIEASRRVLGMTHYDAQIIGGIVLHRGGIAEMKTGEGKTLAATLPVYLNALQGKGAHVVTVNDYLAKRDKEWMGQIYPFFGFKLRGDTS